MNTDTAPPLAEHVMIDLETMGTGPDAAIVAIGAVAFEPATERITATHYQVVDLQSAVDMGGQMTASTVLWWLQQGDAARAELARPGEPLRMALQRLGEWLRLAALEGVQVWGCGSDFDNVILASAYRRAGMPLPWRWSRNRRYRTVRALHPNVMLAREGTHHNALDDAAYQAQHLMLMLADRGTA